MIGLLKRNPDISYCWKITRYKAELYKNKWSKNLQINLDFVLLKWLEVIFKLLLVF